MPITLLPADGPLGRSPLPPRLVETRVDRLLKLLPSDVLLFYPAVIALCGRHLYWHLAATIAGLVVVVMSLWHDARGCGLPHDWRQYVLRSCAFLAWALVLGNPLGNWVDGRQVQWIAAFLALGIPVAGYLLVAEPSLLE